MLKQNLTPFRPPIGGDRGVLFDNCRAHIPLSPYGYIMTIK